MNDVSMRKVSYIVGSSPGAQVALRRSMRRHDVRCKLKISKINRQERGAVTCCDVPLGSVGKYGSPWGKLLLKLRIRSDSRQARLNLLESRQQTRGAIDSRTIKQDEFKVT